MGNKHQELEDVFLSGTEGCFNADNGSRTSVYRDTDISHAVSEEKRLKWVSAQDRTSGASFASSTSLTSNSSVEQLLSQREMDPETMLRNLGFGDIRSDDPISRVPDRFLVNLHMPHQQVDLPQLLNQQHSDFQPLIAAMKTNQSDTMQTEPTTEMNGTENQTAAESKTVAGRKQQQPSFSMVLQGLKFIHHAQAQPLPPLDEETERIRSLPSILHLANRKALAQQGFYGSEYTLSKSVKDQKKESKRKFNSSSATDRPSSAVDKRKQFQDSFKSRSENLPLTENHKDVNSDLSEQSQSIDSFEHGFNLCSFSDRISSDSSFESSDSNFEERYLFCHNSISNLQRQYQEAICVEIPKFDDLDLSKSEAKDPSISTVRKEQVDRLMLSGEDEADYFAQSLLGSTLKEKDIVLLKVQQSTQSTITDESPNTLIDSSFSYDQVSKDAESKTNIPIQSNPEKLLENLSNIFHQPISSADNVQEDGKDGKDKNSLMDKSNSTYSDSSGFADVDTVGEITQQITDLPQKTNHPENSTTKLDKIESSLTSHHDNKTLHIPSLSVQDTYSNDSEIPKDGSKNKTKANENDGIIHVCKKDVEHLDKENVIPTLTQISYVHNEAPDKSLVYSINLPLLPKDQSSLIGTNKAMRYISSVNIEVDNVSDTDSAKYSNSCCSIKQVGCVKHVEVKYEDASKTADKELSSNEPDANAWWDPSSFNVQTVTNQAEMLGGGELSDIKLPTRLYKKDLQRATNSLMEVTEGNSVKGEILSKKKAKEILLSSRNQTIDWLLKSERQNFETHPWKGQGPYLFKTGRPLWASTPDLKNKGISAKSDGHRQKLKDSHHSFDYINDENEKDFDYFDNISFRADHDKENWSSMSKLNDNFRCESHILENRKQHETNQEVTEDMSNDSIHESIDRNQPSIAGSSFGVPEDHLNYVRLTCLVNGPSMTLGACSRLSNRRYKPSVHIKNWIMLSRQRHLEEETRLLQFVIQHYKTEMCVMETFLLKMYEDARTELTPEHRREVEELQQLWSEVHKEVIKMEDLLASRLRRVMMGNEFYSPFNAMEIVQAMINLLREQLYHVQMCSSRDGSCRKNCVADANQSVSEVTSAAEELSAGSAWVSTISSQIAEIKTNLKQSEEAHMQELQQRIIELKASLLAEVKSEISSTTNTKILQLQLEARDNEIRRLKMELLLQNVNSGKARQRQKYESDV